MASAFAQNAPEQANKNLTIYRTDEAPQIDGILSEAMWENASYTDDFLQASPLEYRSPSERTEAYIAYDEDALYVGFFVHDSRPDEITANVLEQEGNLANDDKVIIILDPFDNQTSGYLFQINPNGVRKQAIFLSGTQASYDWAGIWNGTSKIVDGGWTAELEIPFKSLSFDPLNGTWGVNFGRDLQRAQEEMAWYSRAGSFYPDSSGKMDGFYGVTQGMGLDVVPAISGSFSEDKIVGSESSEIQPSVDLFYKVTPQINLALTVNTDFSATEADTNTLNNSKFRRFFEEKRAFFLNDFDAFNFGLASADLDGVKSGNNALAFYSRRIGLSEDGTPVDIVGGAKISGRVGDTEFGALIMRQDETTQTRGDITEVIDPTNAIVVRASQNVFAESKIGVIFTDGNPAENESNSLYGTDFRYRKTDFYGGKTLDAVFMYQQTEDPDHNDNQASYSAAFAIGGNNGWTGGGQYFAVEENYHAGLGFTQRTNSELVSAQLRYAWDIENHPVQRTVSQIEFIRWQDLDTGELDSEEIAWVPIWGRFTRGDTSRLKVIQRKESVSLGDNPSGDLGIAIPIGEYTDLSYDFRYTSPTHWDIVGELDYKWGDYFTGTFTNINPLASWQANRHVLLGLGYDFTKYELGTESVFTREVEFSVNIAFNASWTLASKIEYDNVRRQAAFTNRLRWNMRPGQDLWIVFNQGMVDQDDDYKFAVENTAAAFKLRYTFRY
tara:strand:- start:49970 stop:52141 length:2172 start_codon:yes stop_codon:yes gene_type:complete